MSRRARLVALAVGVAIAINVAAVALIDAPSDGRRRSAAEHDLRARLAHRGVHGASVTCESGQRCTVTRDGEAVTVDPREPDLATPLNRP